MKSIWLPYDDTLDQYARNKVTSLMRTFLFLIPAIAVVLATVNFIFGSASVALATLALPFFFLPSMYFLNKGYINMVMVIVTTVLILSTSFICLIGAGIHEVGIVIFPVIVFFSSLVMNIRGVIATTSVVVLCLLFVVLEEQINLLPRETVISSWLDMIVAFSVLTVHSFMTFSFSSITRDNLEKVRNELQNQERYKKEIEENLSEKTELLRLVHHRVKNNLLLINSLMDLEGFENPDVKEDFKEISDSIHTIARAHDPLYHTDDYKQVAIKPYLEKLIFSFIQSNPVKDLEIEITDSLIFHEKALLLGIVLQKTMSSLALLSRLELSIKLESTGTKHMLNFISKNGIELSLENDSLISLFSDQMDAEFYKSGKNLRLTFPS